MSSLAFEYPRNSNPHVLVQQDRGEHELVFPERDETTLRHLFVRLITRNREHEFLLLGLETLLYHASIGVPEEWKGKLIYAPLDARTIETWECMPCLCCDVSQPFIEWFGFEALVGRDTPCIVAPYF